jgi:O-succinylbenzoic acid--CoA ligase
MLRLSFHSSPPDLTALPDDENIRPAITLINNWYAGADSFTFYSSGSTGIPTPIVLSQTFLIASAKRTIKLFGITSSDRLLLALNTSFMGGMMMVVRAIVAQCELIYLSPADVNSSNFDTLPPIKLASLVPAQLPLLLKKDNNNPFSKIENLLLGGAPVSKSMEQQLATLKSTCHFFHTYGMTETASHVAIRPLKNDNSPYEALDGFEFSQDENGCLIIHHINEPAFTLASNDVVKLLSPHAFEWIGRIDWVVNSGGIKFSLEKAEECVVDFLYQNQLHSTFTSYKCPDETWGEKWILIITESLSPKLSEQLKAYCQKVLGKYIYPKEILQTNKIVYLSSGKVDRFNSYLEATKPSI